MLGRKWDVIIKLNKWNSKGKWKVNEILFHKYFIRYRAIFKTLSNI